MGWLMAMQLYVLRRWRRKVKIIPPESYRDTFKLEICITRENRLRAEQVREECERVAQAIYTAMTHATYAEAAEAALDVIEEQLRRNDLEY